jgi:cytochrome c oxidase subunit 2
MLSLSSKGYLFLGGVLALATGLHLGHNKTSAISQKEEVSQADPEQELNAVSNDVDGKSLYLSRCAACHGDQAEGNRSQMTAALASMPRWYLEEQLQKFRGGLRGAHPKDAGGQRMKAVAQALDLTEQRQIIDYLEKVPPVAQKSTMDGDVEWGKELFNVNCAMCHRYNGHGMSGFKSAPLNGQQDWYLLAQMDKFDQRIRGYHEDDVSGPKMHLELDALPTRKDRLAILAYISTLSEKYPIQKDQQR